jgi:Rieske Fe-S protein
MRRASGLRSLDAPTAIDLSRREFCTYACLGAAFAGCIDGGTGAVQTGGLNGSDGTMPPDAAGSGSGSGSGMHPDGGVQAGACSGTNVDVGLATSFVANVPKQFGSPNYFFVVRDSNGLYALSSKCTHQHVVVNVSGSQYFCPAHGATFTFNGAVLGGPTNTPLPHYSMCTLPNGHVGVQTSIVVSASTRLVA